LAAASLAALRLPLLRRRTVKLHRAARYLHARGIGRGCPQSPPATVSSSQVPTAAAPNSSPPASPPVKPASPSSSRVSPGPPGLLPLPLLAGATAGEPAGSLLAMAVACPGHWPGRPAMWASGPSSQLPWVILARVKKVPAPYFYFQEISEFAQNL
jgi:hypothetical protein